MTKEKKNPFGEIYLPKPKPPRPAPATDLPELESRECICGCGKTFKVMPSSPLKYASRRCMFKEDE